MPITVEIHGNGFPSKVNGDFTNSCDVVQIYVDSTDKTESAVRIKLDSCVSSPPPPSLPRKFASGVKRECRLKVLSVTNQKDVGEDICFVLPFLPHVIQRLTLPSLRKKN